MHEEFRLSWKVQNMTVMFPTAALPHRLCARSDHCARPTLIPGVSVFAKAAVGHIP